MAIFQVNLGYLTGSWFFIIRDVEASFFGLGALLLTQSTVSNH